MLLTNGRIIGADFCLQQGDLQIENGRITKIGNDLSGGETIDVTGKYILPGFIDTHIHGCCGCRFDAEEPDFDKMTTFLASQGVTSVAATTSTSEFGRLLKQLERIAEAAGKTKGAKIAGIHAEGPFLNVERKGGMNAAYIIPPEKEKIDDMIRCSKGLLRIIAMAPEKEGALEVIRHAVSRGLIVSMGHTSATYDQAQEAVTAGASRATHTFNAMRPLNHREPGVLGAVLLNESVCCEMICDYVHLHPATVKLIYELKGADNINMISDSVLAAGLEAKEYMAGEIKHSIIDGVVRLPDGTISGSAMTLADGVRHLASDGIPLSDISKMVSLNPAKALKIEQETGSIAVGKVADLVVLDKDYNVELTFVDGACVYRRS